MNHRALPMILLLLAACVTAPEVKRPQLDFTLPDRFREGLTSTEAVEDEWWRSFGDPRLEKVIEEVLAHNHDLRAAAARIQAADAQARFIGADWLPQASTRFEAGRSRQNFIGFPIPGGGTVLSTRSNRMGLSLDLSWEIDLWGRIRSAQEGALADVDAALADLVAARLSLIGQAMKAWFAAAEARKQVDLAQETLQSRRSTTVWARGRYQGGVGSPAELRLFISQEAGAEAVLRLREQQLDALLRQLEVLMGRYPSADLITGDDLPAIPKAIPAGLPADLIARRPDLVAAERRVAAEEARVASSRAALYPRISLTASTGTASEQLRHLVDGRFWIWNLMSNLMQPIFQGGRLVAQLDQSKARSHEALARFLGTALGAYGEVESALSAIDHLGRREEALARSAGSAREARRLASERYASGLAGADVLLESQRATLLSESLLLTARRERVEARINLYLALGGGFKPPTEAEEPDESKGDSER